MALPFGGGPPDKVLHDDVRRRLEFDAVLSRLAACASFSGGKERALNLEPSNNPIWVEEGQRETAEARQMLETAEAPPFGGLRDIRPLAGRARKGGLLDGKELAEIAWTLEGAGRLRRHLERHTVENGLLRAFSQALNENAPLRSEIARCVHLDDGTVLDEASPELARLRREIRASQSRMRKQLDGMLQASAVRPYLQEPLITVRGGRYVLPVKQEHRSQVPGVVHDQSASGATVFIEPLAVVETGNELRRLQAEEEEEIRRILRALTEKVAASAGELVQTAESLAHLDFVFAKARLALEWNASAPRLGPANELDIREGRHPLLPGDVVPVSIKLKAGARALVITGPNTGGKTAALKTVGLFAAMAQAGLQIPAASGSSLPFFDAVYADIGDEQSLEQSLSTFSSHMKTIIGILQRATRGSLVLLDELGAGTDPAEGAALAVAILEHCVAEIGCTTIVTTHYEALKAFAYEHPQVENAAVAFDIETLRPTYELLPGVAGSSHALRIADRMGLAPAILSRAESLLDPQQRRFEMMLREVESDRRAARRDRDAAERLRTELEAQAAALRQEREELRSRREALLQEARQDARRLVEEARREAERAIAQARRAQRTADLEAARSARQNLEALAASVGPVRPESDPEPGLTPNLRPGQWVRMKQTGQTGELLEISRDGKQVQVRIGPMRIHLPAHQIEAASESSGGRRREAPRGAASGLAEQKALTTQSELHIRGMGAEDALDRLEKYLDDAVLAGLTRVRIVHGKGEGILRRLVAERLRDHPHVRSHYMAPPQEGGSGATVVELKD